MKYKKPIDGICHCREPQPQTFINGETTKKGKLKKVKLPIVMCKLCGGKIVNNVIITSHSTGIESSNTSRADASSLHKPVHHVKLKGGNKNGKTIKDKR